MTNDNELMLPGQQEELPAYLQEHAGEGAEEMTEDVLRLKVVQASADSELKDEHGEGALVANPGSLLAAEYEKGIRVIPILRYTSWKMMPDLNDKDPIVEVYDRNDPIAVKARDPKTWKEVYGPDNDMKRTHSECINFLIAICSGPLAGRTAVLTFDRGSHFLGKRMESHIAAKKAPIYAYMFNVRVTQESSRGGKPYYAARAEPQDGFIPADKAEITRAMHIEARDSFEAMKKAATGSEANTHAPADTDDGGGEFDRF